MNDKYHRNWKKYSRSFIISKQKTKSRKVEKRRRNHKPYLFAKRQNVHVIDKNGEIVEQIFHEYCHIKAPCIFSLVENEKGVFNFLQKIKHAYDDNKKVLVKLDDVKEISIDAILVLLSNMVRFKVANIGFNGTRPNNKTVRQKLEKSGFFEFLYDNSPVDDKEQYSFQRMESHIYTHGQKTVAPQDADLLVKYASKSIWGEPRRCQGVQKTLVELMHNTYDHAGLDKGEKHWWLSVEHIPKNREVKFSFIDFGVGIFRSLENKSPDEPLFGALERIKLKFPWADSQVEKLKLILEGKVQLTQSKDYYRGKGLAKIFQLYLQNKISSLIIISNYASANIDSDDFHILKQEFMGTFISFNINQNTISLPWEKM